MSHPGDRSSRGSHRSFSWARALSIRRRPGREIVVADPVEDSEEEDPEEEEEPEAHAAAPVGEVPQPAPLQVVPPHRSHISSQSSVCGPLYQHTPPPVSYATHARVLAELDYYKGQVQEMTHVRSCEAHMADTAMRLERQLAESQERCETLEQQMAGFEMFHQRTERQLADIHAQHRAIRTMSDLQMGYEMTYQQQRDHIAWIMAALAHMTPPDA